MASILGISIIFCSDQINDQCRAMQVGFKLISEGDSKV
jgi:hypothetical protein